MLLDGEQFLINCIVAVDGAVLRQITEGLVLCKGDYAAVGLELSDDDAQQGCLACTIKPTIAAFS